MDPYRYDEKPSGDRLVIDAADTAKAVLSVREGDQEAAIVIGAAACRAVTEALHEAAGLGRPMILETPAPRERLAGGPHGDELVSVTPSAARSASNVPGVLLGAGGGAVRLIGDEPLRVAIALVEAMREAAEPEPDPAEVEELAEVLSEGGALSTDTLVERLAELALRWMNGRGKRDA